MKHNPTFRSKREIRTSLMDYTIGYETLERFIRLISEVSINEQKLQYDLATHIILQYRNEKVIYKKTTII